MNKKPKAFSEKVGTGFSAKNAARQESRAVERDNHDRNRNQRSSQQRERFVKTSARFSDEKRGGNDKRERFPGVRQVKTKSAERGKKTPPPPFFFDKTHDSTGERIAKRLARVGIASRREAESMIAAGRIGVNGKILNHPAVNVTPEDVITVDGKKLPPQERTRLWLYHKPAGLVTTNRDEKGRPTVFEKLPEGMPRVISIGRLDINTEGLLLLTNDGGLARLLELPATGWLRRYRVRAHGRVKITDLDTLKEGIAIDGIFYGSIEASLEREQGSNVWLSIGLREGKNREVKTILGHLGLDVTRLIRVSYGPFQLGDMAPGAVKEIRGRTLRDQLGEKLIQAANVDFDAPIITPMARTRSSSSEAAFSEKQAEKSRDNHKGKREWISSSPPRQRQFKGDSGNFDDNPQKKKIRNKSNNANVWMAPGARPQGKKSRPFETDKGGFRQERQPEMKPYKRNR